MSWPKKHWLGQLGIVLSLGVLCPLKAEAQVAEPTEQETRALRSLPKQLGPEESASLEVDIVNRHDAGCGEAPPSWQFENGNSGCPFGDVTLGINVTSRSTAPFGDVEVFGSFFRSTRGPFRPERQLNSRSSGLNRENSLALVGLNQNLLQKRVKLTAQIGVSQSWQTPIANIPLLPDRFNKESGTSQQYELQAKLVDSPGLKWSVRGELSDVSENYYLGTNLALRRTTMLPGRRVALSSSFKLNQVHFKSAFENYRAAFGSSETQKIGLSYKGISLRLSQRRSAVNPILLTNFLTSQTEKSAVSMDVDLYSLTPMLAAKEGGAATLLPKILSLNWISGRTNSNFLDLPSQYRRSGWELFGIWDTAIGQTTLGYRRDTNTGFTSGVHDSQSKFIHASHSIRTGNWRIGIDGMVMKDSSSGSIGHGDTMISFGQSIAYSKKDGPEFNLRIGKDQTRSATFDGSFSYFETTTRIVAQLDLSKFLQKRFERPDLQLAIEYRGRLGKENYAVSSFEQVLDGWFDRHNRQGSFLSFSMKI